MIREPEAWYPGSFTKNFSWGTGSGLLRLYKAINICFDGQMNAVPRVLAIQRLERHKFVWHIPLNFFLLNEIVDGQSVISVDELVYQALNFPHSASFDKIALSAFHNSFVGHWDGSNAWQAYPSPWAANYIKANVASRGGWETSRVTADSIERFVVSSGKYRAKSARKLATNLNYLYRNANIDDLASSKVERWWVDSMFLILDRAFAEVRTNFDPSSIQQRVLQSSFLDFSGPRSKNRELAVLPISSLYWACGGRDRWSRDAVQARQQAFLPNVGWFANSDDPFYAIYNKDPNIVKVVPRICAMLAKNLADFEEIDAEELVNWDPLAYIRRKTQDALSSLKSKNVNFDISADELLRLTRG